MASRTFASAELEGFVQRLALATAFDNGGAPFFASGSPIVAARAPGRLDVMGGIADYSGSLVLELPAREATFVAVQAAGEGVEVISRMDADGLRQARLSSLAWGELLAADDGEARRRLREPADVAWAAYVLGPILLLARKQIARAPAGLRIYVESRVPVGKGLSSSAAIEVATARAFLELADAELPGDDLARLCQAAENNIVGAPCGVMDQMTSALGRTDELLALRCQPAIVEGYVRIPRSIGFWGVDSGIRHAVSGADYGSVRTGAFMGYRMIAELAGMSASPDGPGRVDVDDGVWHGYLANVGPVAFEREFAGALPDRIDGREFLDRYRGITDRATAVHPEREYAVLAPTAHPVHEHARVVRFRELLPAADDEATRRELGRLMFESHASYSACGLGSEGTDRLVTMVRDARPSCGLYGAKITGGGSGGTVAILGRADAGPIVEEIARHYAAATGRASAVFCGSSDGACFTPCLRIG